MHQRLKFRVHAHGTNNGQFNTDSEEISLIPTIRFEVRRVLFIGSQIHAFALIYARNDRKRDYRPSGFTTLKCQYSVQMAAKYPFIAILSTVFTVLERISEGRSFTSSKIDGTIAWIELRKLAIFLKFLLCFVMPDRGGCT